jgi:hypothetical protein
MCPGYYKELTIFLATKLPDLLCAGEQDDRSATETSLLHGGNTETTLAHSSAGHTPPGGQTNRADGTLEVVSTPQPPNAHMRFDTLEEAEKHYKAYARRKGFSIRYNYRKKIRDYWSIHKSIDCMSHGRPPSKRERRHAKPKTSSC